jgi:Txe/YoeB family toxin of Txe-Axe toxin-antitoxin module
LVPAAKNSEMRRRKRFEFAGTDVDRNPFSGTGRPEKRQSVAKSSRIERTDIGPLDFS